MDSGYSEWPPGSCSIHHADQLYFNVRRIIGLMPYKFNFRQKSPTRRFLLILGFATFVACVTLGLMIMFWDRVNEHLSLSKTQRILFGGLFVIYGLLRFSRLFKEEEPENEE
jgi:hypothetical protein